MAYRNVVYELAVLNRLCVQLEWLGFDAVLIESIAGLRVTSPDTTEALWVSVGSRGQYFLWDGDFCLAWLPASGDEAEEVARFFRDRAASAGVEVRG